MYVLKKGGGAFLPVTMANGLIIRKDAQNIYFLSYRGGFEDRHRVFFPRRKTFETSRNSPKILTFSTMSPEF